MSNVISLEDRQPHLTVNASDGVHVIPCSLVRDVISGVQPPAIIGDAVLCKIIEEWFIRTILK